ncbi:MAG: peptide ABC transporter substrate-binding protein [Ostreibacterium sp.]
MKLLLTLPKISPTINRILTLIALTIISIASITNVQAETVLRRGNGAEPKTLDPQINRGVAGSNILRDLFEGLVAEDKDGKLVPGIAKNWDVSQDGKTYTFHLRDSYWTDGTPVTANDFVYGWQRAVNPATGTSYSFLLYPVKNAENLATGKIKDFSKLGIKALDDKTLVVKLNDPTPYFLGMLTNSVTDPIPKKVIEKYGRTWTRPENMVSNGPFKMSKWIPQAGLTLVKSDSYWDRNAVKLDKVIYYPTEDKNAEFKRFRAGELDWTSSVPNGQIKFIKKNLAKDFKVSNYLGVYFYGFNTTKPPFKGNLALRKALSLAIDRDRIVNKITGAGEKPAYGFVVPGVLNADPYLPAYAKWSKKARLALAKKLYKQAGYSKTNPATFEILYNTSENHKKIAIAIASMWKQALGVKVNLVNKEWKVYLQTRKQKNTQAFRSSWIGDYNDAHTFLGLFVANSGLNDVGFHSPQFDSLMKQAGQAQDMNKRTQILKQAEEIFIDSYSVMPIYFYVTKRLINPKLRGYSINVMAHSRSKYMYKVK